MSGAVAVITDIHGNLPALKAALARIDELGIEQVYCGGDLVGYGPWPNEVCDLIQGSRDPDDLRQLRLRDRSRRRGLHVRLPEPARSRPRPALGRLDARAHQPGLEGLHAGASVRPSLRARRQADPARPRLASQGERVPLRGQACQDFRADRARLGLRRDSSSATPTSRGSTNYGGVAVRQLRISRQAEGRRPARAASRSSTALAGRSKPVSSDSSTTPSTRRARSPPPAYRVSTPRSFWSRPETAADDLSPPPPSPGRVPGVRVSWPRS